MTREQFIAHEIRLWERGQVLEWFLNRAAIILALMLIASLAHAATKHTVTYTESLYKATSKVHDVLGTSEADAHAKCKAEAGAQTAAATYSCKTPVTTDIVTIIPDPVLGSATLTWSVPAQNTDGSALTDLTGYVVHYGTSVSALDKTIALPSPSMTAYVVQGLAIGTYYFSIEAVNAAGVHSNPSGIVSKTL